MGQFGIEESAIEGTMKIVRGLFARHDAGKTNLGAGLAVDVTTD